MNNINQKNAETMKVKREKTTDRLLRMLAFDAKYMFEKRQLAGMDEVGRGPLAGPVLAACIILERNSAIIGINDSKKISEKRRKFFAQELENSAICIGFGQVESNEIDQINILQATKKAFYIAVDTMKIKPNIILIDGRELIDISIKQHAIIGGDALSYSIAAASIVAKVKRDAIMCDMNIKYPEYGFAKNKGYGTAEHILALKKYGPCPIHRKSFLTRII